MSKKILFIGHDASRTGAPMVLLHFLSWLKSNSDLPFQLLLREGGELEPDYERLAPVLCASRPTVAARAKTRALRQLGLERVSKNGVTRNLIRHFSKDHIGLVYSNTIVNGDVLELLSHLNCPVISHVHELEYNIQQETGPELFEKVRNHTTHYVAVSEAVKQNLIVTHSVPAESIDVIYEFIPTESREMIDAASAGKRIRAELEIPEHSLVVGAAGTTGWRKGPDLFVQLAQSVLRKRPNLPVRFLWVGGETSGPTWSAIRHDIEKSGLGDYVHFLGAKPNPLAYFAAFDLFAMVSREDPFPLVVLEAASLGKPIVCFDRSGGAREFVEDDCGFVIPYLDLDSMAAKVLELGDSADLRQRLGGRAHQKVRQRHDVAIVSPSIFDLINRFMNAAGIPARQ